MKLIKITFSNGKFIRDCPYNKWYEAINRYLIAKIGDDVCKSCKYNKGVKLITETPYVKCEHPEVIEILPKY